jgi:hypothetical protein
MSPNTAIASISTFASYRKLNEIRLEKNFDLLLEDQQLELLIELDDDLEKLNEKIFHYVNMKEEKQKIYFQNKLHSLHRNRSYL